MNRLESIGGVILITGAGIFGYLIGWRSAAFEGNFAAILAVVIMCGGAAVIAFLTDRGLAMLVAVVFLALGVVLQSIDLPPFASAALMSVMASSLMMLLIR